MSDAKKLYVTAIVSTTGVAVACYGLLTLWKRYLDTRPPSSWRKVGELVDLLCFPIKSCGPERLEECECVELSLQKGFLRDRVFMVTGKDGNFVSGRIYPKMTQIYPKAEGEILTLSAKDADGVVKININDLNSQPKGKARVWGQTVDVVDCGDEVAAWLSNYLLNAADGLRLVYYPQVKPTRHIPTEYRVFRKILQKDLGALTDVSSYTLISEASVEELNTRLPEPVVPQGFRPNFIIRGAQAYEEDTWDWVKIGDVVFRNIKPTTRCLFTTVNPHTGTKYENQEPLNTLRGYRQVQDPKLRRYTGNSPMMGIHLAMRVPGSVKMGDSIYVPN